MKTIAIAAAAVLLSAGLAAAQTDTPAPSEGAPPAAAPQAGPAGDTDARGPGMERGRPDWARGGMRGEGKKMHPRGGPHGHHGMMMRPSKGASFVFTAPGEGRIMIKCADEDSTQACADAVRPMLELMLQAGRGQAQ